MNGYFVNHIFVLDCNNFDLDFFYYYCGCLAEILLIMTRHHFMNLMYNKKKTFIFSFYYRKTYSFTSNKKF